MFCEPLTIGEYSFTCLMDGILIAPQNYAAKLETRSKMDVAFETTIVWATFIYLQLHRLIVDLHHAGLQVRPDDQSMHIRFVRFTDAYKERDYLAELEALRNSSGSDIKFPPSVSHVIDIYHDTNRIAELKAQAQTAATKPPPKKGFVYLLRSTTGYFKIGRTTSPSARLHRFEVKLPFEVAFEHIINTEDYHHAESELHQRYAHRRVNGEWFALTPEEVDQIRSIKEM